VYHVDVVLARHLDELLEEAEIHALRGRVAGKVHDQHLRLGIRAADRLVELIEEVRARHHWHVADVCPRDHRPVDMDRIARIGHQHDIAGVESREREMGEAFLGADGDDRFAVRIEIDVVTGLVPVADGAPQPRNALGNRVAMRVGTLHRLDQLLHDVRRRGLVGIAHRQIDDVLAATTRAHLQLPRDVEDVGRQALDAGELFHRESGESGKAGRL
jgi:hypothetical protein